VGVAKGKGFSRVVGDAGLGAFGLLLGAGLFLLFQTAAGGASDSVAEPALVFDSPAAGPGAESPAEAVRAFLDAEAADDAVAAFDLLSEADRHTHVSAQMWASRQSLGDITSWNWADTEALTTTVALEPGLSLNKGWTPASTTFRWGTVDENGWRVSLAGSTAEPASPEPDLAINAASAWLNGSSRCSATADQRLVLAAPSSTFDGLCSTGGVVADDTSSPVVGRVAAELESSYGPGAAVWARSVALENGVELTLVAIGDEWIVIDAFAS